MLRERTGRHGSSPSYPSHTESCQQIRHGVPGRTKGMSTGTKTPKSSATAGWPPSLYSSSDLMPLSSSTVNALVKRALAVQLALAASVTGLSAQTVDHASFDALLRAHVVGGAVNYDAFKADPKFAAYLASLDRVQPGKLSESERLAFWINVYNAYTIQLIVAKDERESIRNVNKSFGLLKLKGPWSDPIVKAAGRTLTLDQVEHEIIRKEFNEPRIHFALVCAAIGCPPLRSEAYTSAKLESQLEEQGRIFIRQSPTKNRVDVASRTVYVSLVFTWYKDDFGGSDKRLGQYLANWYPVGAERTMLESGDFKVVRTDYDWTLNSQSKMRVSAGR